VGDAWGFFTGTTAERKGRTPLPISLPQDKRWLVGAKNQRIGTR
jgi:hypothetical protein